MSDWHPNAKRVIIPGSEGGDVLTGRPKIILHTTEGSSVAGAESAYRSRRSAPHFTLSPRTLHQHIPLNRSAYSLEHPSGTSETNRAGLVTQIELQGFAANVGKWSESHYRKIRDLCLWIHAQTGVPLVQVSNGIHADFTHPVRIPASEFAQWSGVCGHVHVPNQPAGHTDPGVKFHIGKVITA